MGSVTNQVAEWTGNSPNPEKNKMIEIGSSNNPNAALDAAEEAQIAKQEQEAARSKALSDAQTKQANIDNMNSIRASLSINKTLG